MRINPYETKTRQVYRQPLLPSPLVKINVFTLYALFCWKLTVSSLGKSTCHLSSVSTYKMHRHDFEKRTISKRNTAQIHQIAQIKLRRVVKRGIAEPNRFQLRQICHSFDGSSGLLATAWRLENAKLWSPQEKSTSDWNAFTQRNEKRVRLRMSNWRFLKQLSPHLNVESFGRSAREKKRGNGVPFQCKSPFSKHPFLNSSIIREGKSDSIKGKTEVLSSWRHRDSAKAESAKNKTESDERPLRTNE